MGSLKRANRFANLRWVGKARHEDDCKLDRSAWIVCGIGKFSHGLTRQLTHRPGGTTANSVRDIRSCRSKSIKASPTERSLCVQLQVTRPRELGLKKCEWSGAL